MEGHDEQAQELEYELADMEKQQDDLDDRIHSAKDEWEAKKRDGSVPGAGTGEGREDDAPDSEDDAPDPEDTDS